MKKISNNISISFSNLIDPFKTFAGLPSVSNADARLPALCSGNDISIGFCGTENQKPKESLHRLLPICNWQHFATNGILFINKFFFLVLFSSKFFV